MISAPQGNFYSFSGEINRKIWWELVNEDKDNLSNILSGAFSKSSGFFGAILGLIQIE